MFRSIRRRALALVSVAALASAPSALAQSSTTVLVSPFPGSPGTSGNTLVITLANITDASSSKPYVIQLDPGTYDLQYVRLHMKPYVSIVGSGQGNTFVQGWANNPGDLNNGLLWGTNNVELRNLTVYAYSVVAGDYPIPFYVQATSPTLRNVTTLGAGGGATWGMRNAGGSPLIEDCTLQAVGGAANQAYGLANSSTTTGRPLIRRSVISASGVNAYGIYNDQNSLPSEIRDSQVSGTGTATSYGLYANSDLGAAGTLKIGQSVIEGSGGSTYNVGILFQASGGNLTIEDSQARGKGGSASYGLGYAGATLTALHTELSGATYSITAGSYAAGTGKVALSRLSGPTLPGLPLTCSAITTASYSFVTGPACP